MQDADMLRSLGKSCLYRESVLTDLDFHNLTQLRRDTRRSEFVGFVFGEDGAQIYGAVVFQSGSEGAFDFSDLNECLFAALDFDARRGQNALAALSMMLSDGRLENEFGRSRSDKSDGGGCK